MAKRRTAYVGVSCSPDEKRQLMIKWRESVKFKAEEALGRTYPLARFMVDTVLGE